MTQVATIPIAAKITETIAVTSNIDLILKVADCHYLMAQRGTKKEPHFQLQLV